LDLSDADVAAWNAGSWKAIPQTTLTGTAAAIAGRITDIAGQGITEVIYQPIGPDIAGELEAFMAASREPLVTSVKSG
jgi:5,10-methylenetetrahydromethanopterin reductase